jgi:hypothetical protein
MTFDAGAFGKPLVKNSLGDGLGQWNTRDAPDSDLAWLVTTHTLQPASATEWLMATQALIFELFMPFQEGPRAQEPSWK